MSQPSRGLLSPTKTLEGGNMNDARRKALAEVQSRFDGARSDMESALEDLQTLAWQEQDARTGTKAANVLKVAVTAAESAVSAAESVTSLIEEASA